MFVEEDMCISNKPEICNIIGRAVVDLSVKGQPVNRSTLGLELLSLADRDNDEDRILLYWIARKAINQPQNFAESRY